jgi:hypothetical protein
MASSFSLVTRSNMVTDSAQEAQSCHALQLDRPFGCLLGSTMFGILQSMMQLHRHKKPKRETKCLLTIVFGRSRSLSFYSAERREWPANCANVGLPIWCQPGLVALLIRRQIIADHWPIAPPAYRYSSRARIPCCVDILAVRVLPSSFIPTHYLH